MTRSQFFLGAMACAVALSLSAPLRAGNIALTGHDDDYHGYFGDTNAQAQLKALVSFAENGSALPFLTFDAGSELTGELTALGITNFTNINPTNPIASSVFDPTKYSAFVVASDSSCGGCDNNATTAANLAADSAAIGTFLDAGGGIVGLAGASDPAYYSFLPDTASAPPITGSSGYSQTALGASLGIPAVNGDPTHNTFTTPGTGGTSAAYGIAEIDTAHGNVPETLVCVGCTTSSIITGGTPEPSAWLLLATALIPVGLKARRYFAN